MDRFLKYLGIFALITIFFGGLFSVWKFFQIKEMEQSLINNLGAIIIEIPKDEKYAYLGNYISCPPRNENNMSWDDSWKSKVEVTCDFENLTAEIHMDLEFSENEWKLKKLRVFDVK